MSLPLNLKSFARVALGILCLVPLRALPAAVDFNADVRPILSNNCFFCHGPDAHERKADLRLDTEEGATRDLGGYAALVPGNLKTSEMWARIMNSDPEEVMPPPRGPQGDEAQGARNYQAVDSRGSKVRKILGLRVAP